MPEKKPILRYPARDDAADILLVATYAGVLNDISEEVVKVRSPHGNCTFNLRLLYVTCAFGEP